MREFLSKLRQRWIQRPFNGLSRAAVFDAIYTRSTWGKSEDGDPFSGTGSRDERIVGPYVTRIQAFLDELGSPSVVDLGCGDFSVGNRLRCGSYIGCDISDVVITSNRSRFSDRDFRKIDIVHDELPAGDVGIVRQVLQHLDNSSISNFVNRQLPYKYLVVTESVPAGDFVPNMDMAISPSIRLPFGSGIDLTRPPFSLPHPVVRSFDIPGQYNRHPNVIRTTIFKLIGI
jgi:hypothetical protein